jgi:hypothetical protein
MGLEFKPKVIELTDDVLQSELRELEDKHGMSSERFLERYNRGELGHCAEFVRWSGLLGVASKAGILERVQA